MRNNQKIKRVKNITIKEFSYESLSSINLVYICKLYFGTLVLALHYGDKIRKIRTSFKTFVSKKAAIWWLKESQGNDKLLSKIMSFSYHME